MCGYGGGDCTPKFTGISLVIVNVGRVCEQKTEQNWFEVLDDTRANQCRLGVFPNVWLLNWLPF